MYKLVVPFVAALAAPFALAPSALAQSACLATDLGTSLGSANDTIHPGQPIGFAFPLNGVTYTDIHISDHGFAFLSNAGVPTVPAGGAITYNVFTSDFIGFGPCLSCFWADANCGYAPVGVGLGEVFINSSSTACTVTWRGMLTWSDVLPPYTFQMTLYPTGEVIFRYDVDVNNYGSMFAPNAIVGITPGAPAALPAPSDLSAGPITLDPTVFEEFLTPSTFDLADNGLQFIPTNPGWVVLPLGAGTNCAAADTYGAGCDGLTLASNAPAIGANWDLTTTGVNAISPIAIVFFGDARVDPGLPLPTIGIDAPGCSAHISSVLGSLTGNVVAGQATVSIPVPNDPLLVGVTLVAQSLALTPVNNALIATSNGSEGTIGN